MKNEHLEPFDVVVGAIAAFIAAIIVYVYFNVPDMWYYTVTIGVWVLPALGIVWFLAYHNKKAQQYPRTRTHRRNK